MVQQHAVELIVSISCKMPGYLDFDCLVAGGGTSNGSPGAST